MANFVQFPAPVGMINMDYVLAYKADESEVGLNGIRLILGNGQKPIAVWENTAVTSSLVKVNLTLTAVTAGVAGNSITVAYVNTGNDVTLNIEVTGTDIVVNLGTDGVGTVTSTEGEVYTAMIGTPTVTDLVSLVLAGDGLTNALAFVATNLASGVDDTSEGDRDTFLEAVNTAFLL